ncbi:MAG: hypothetical protein NVSMB24_34500 [Mucilaginibacter sp.]
MKYLRVTLFLALTFLMQHAIADDDHRLFSSKMKNYIGFGAIITMLLLFILAMIMLLRTFNLLARIVLKPEGDIEEKVIVPLRSAENQKKTTLLAYVVYSITGIAVIFIFFYVIGALPSRLSETRDRVAPRETAKKPILSDGMSTSYENAVKPVTDPAVLSSGKAVFI